MQNQQHIEDALNGVSRQPTSLKITEVTRVDGHTAANSLLADGWELFATHYQQGLVTLNERDGGNFLDGDDVIYVMVKLEKRGKHEAS